VLSQSTVQHRTAIDASYNAAIPRSFSDRDGLLPLPKTTQPKQSNHHGINKPSQPPQPNHSNPKSHQAVDYSHPTPRHNLRQLSHAPNIPPHSHIELHMIANRHHPLPLDLRQHRNRFSRLSHLRDLSRELLVRVQSVCGKLKSEGRGIGQDLEVLRVVACLEEGCDCVAG
jgi:hypothetical protein